jgi:hypothetical protein
MRFQLCNVDDWIDCATEYSAVVVRSDARGRERRNRVSAYAQAKCNCTSGLESIANMTGVVYVRAVIKRKNCLR